MNDILSQWWFHASWGFLVGLYFGSYRFRHGINYALIWSLLKLEQGLTRIGAGKGVKNGG